MMPGSTKTFLNQWSIRAIWMCPRRVARAVAVSAAIIPRSPFVDKTTLESLGKVYPFIGKFMRPSGRCKGFCKQAASLMVQNKDLEPSFLPEGRLKSGKNAKVEAAERRYPQRTACNWR